MAGEADAVHVEHFPLVPVGGGKNRGDRRHFRRITAQFRLHADIARLVKRQQVVVDGEVSVVVPFPAAGIVNGGNILQAFERSS